MANADLAAIELLARSQDHVISRRQLVERGATSDWIGRQVRSRRWRRLFPGVYVLHTGEPTWRTRARAALLYAGPGATLSHRSAAFHRGLRTDPGRTIVVSVPSTRRVRRQPGLQIRVRDRVPPSGGRLRSTYELETVLDIVDEKETTADDVVGLVCALAGRGIPIDALAAAVRARRRVRHRQLLTDIAPLV